MRDTKANESSETYPNDRTTWWEDGSHSADPDEAGATTCGETCPQYRLRNLTGREYCLIYHRVDGTEVLRRIPAEPTKVRVRYNRLFETQAVELYPDPRGLDATIPLVEARPREGVLPTCETVEGLPPAEGRVRLVVDPTVIFALARRGTYRRDLLTLGRARFDPITHRLIGFENLSRMNFDANPDLEEVLSLSHRVNPFWP